MVRAALIATLAATADSAHYAVLAAGSTGFNNYRHQADLCHGYQLLIEKGYDANNVIVLSYDDVASSSRNPFPGKLFNKPTASGVAGKDVYAGCKIDYKGSDCSAKNFLNVLTGKGSGKVLKSTSSDNVFVSFFDHGGVGIIAFPGGTLYKNDMQAAFQTMHDKSMYKKLTFYLESCESGSMFQGMNIPGIYAVSAANAVESSYGTYCGSQAKVNGQNVGSCLGDLFSVNWMEDSDSKDITSESLQTQFDTVQRKTAQSHVLAWSDTSFTTDMVSDYMGKTNQFTATSDGEASANAWSVRELELKQTEYRYQSAETAAERLAAGAELQATLEDQLQAESAYERFLEIIYPGDDDKKADARDVKAASSALPVKSCEMGARDNFVKFGAFDASSGFAMKFHAYIINACADNTHNADTVGAAKQACTSTTVV